jgi:hypothetical protein
MFGINITENSSYFEKVEGNNINTDLSNLNINTGNKEYDTELTSPTKTQCNEDLDNA